LTYNFFSDAAVGRGPTQAIWAQVIKKIVSNLQHWVATITDSYFTPVDLPLFAIQEQNINDFEFYGFVIRQSLLYGFDLFPISPFLLALILQDENLALHNEFITHVADDAAKRLATWPPRPGQLGTRNAEPDLAYGNDPMNLIADCDLLGAFPVYIHILFCRILINSSQISRVRSMSAEQLASLTLILKRGLLLKIISRNDSSILNPTHPFNLALHTGFFRKSHGLLDVSQVFTVQII
jgi:hypothetical protein